MQDSVCYLCWFPRETLLEFFDHILPLVKFVEEYLGLQQQIQLLYENSVLDMKEVSNHLIIDCLSHSFTRINRHGYVEEVIFSANQSIPARRTKSYGWYDSKFIPGAIIVNGEYKMKIEFSGLHYMRYCTPFVVEYQVDINGILSVEYSQNKFKTYHIAKKDLI